MPYCLSQKRLVFSKVIFGLDDVKLLYTALFCTFRAQIQFLLTSVQKDLKLSATAFRPSSHPDDEIAFTFSAFFHCRKSRRLVSIFGKVSMDADA